MAEAILDLDLETCGVEEAVNEVFQLAAVDVVELVGGDDLNIGQKEGRLEPCAGDAVLNTATRRRSCGPSRDALR